MSVSCVYHSQSTTLTIVKLVCEKKILCITLGGAGGGELPPLASPMTTRLLGKGLVSQVQHSTKIEAKLSQVSIDLLVLPSFKEIKLHPYH